MRNRVWRARTRDGTPRQTGELGKKDDSQDWLSHSPLPLFLEVFILKGFKSFVLEVFIPKRLQACFLEVRIVKDLGERQLKMDGLRLEFVADDWEAPPPRVFFVRVAGKGLNA